MNLTEKEIQKIQQNEQESIVFRQNLHKLLGGDKTLASRPLIIGETPNVLAICGADSNLPLTITKKVIDKCMRPEIRDESGKRLKNSGHFLKEDQIVAALTYIREAVMVLKGSRDNTFVAVTDQKDEKGQEIIIAVETNENVSFKKVNMVASLYGRENFPQYIKANIESNNIVAINVEKANKMLHSIGVDFPKENTFISFEDSIAYTTINVNYPKENSMEENRIMANTNNAGTTRKKNGFNDFQQRDDYDFEALEHELLANSSQTEKQINESYRETALALMEKYGFEETQVQGFSEDGFIFIKSADSNSRGFDGWELIKDYFEEIDRLVESYTQEQLQSRLNGDYSVIEYGVVDDQQLQVAIKSKQQEISQEQPVQIPHREEIASENTISTNAEEMPEPEKTNDTLTPKDQLKQRLENGVRQVMDSSQFKNWLSTGGKLYYNNYSFRNAILVWMQKPDASYVMGYEKWKEFGRNVAQGAQGAKIFIPIIASEKYKGSLYGNIKNSLNSQLAKDPSLTDASYRLGTSNLEFTMNRANHLIGFKANGKEMRIFASDEEARRFIDRAIIGKVPTGYNVGTVFDVKDVIIPEYLWVKSGYTKAEIAPDAKGNPVKNRRGEVRIFNTPERQARFQTELDTRIVAKDPAKMQALFDACVAASARKGVPVSLADPSEDSTLGNGASGYFSRATGAIVIDKNLEITNQCAVLFHEMGHADLHKNLDALAAAMGEKITKEMREVQAEAVAYATASTFGIETDTSSFAYLAAYTNGFELQDFQKSLDVIYRETQALTKDIKAELDLMGLNLDLTEKPKEMLGKETLEVLSEKYVNFETEQAEKVQTILNKLPNMIKQNAADSEVIEALKYQKENLDSRTADLDAILASVESLNKADTRDKQDTIINTLDAAMERVNRSAEAYEGLMEKYNLLMQEKNQGSLKADFQKDPKKTLEDMRKDFPMLAKLSDPQLQYIAESKYISRQFSELLQEHPDVFVKETAERAALLHKAASKNGTFVEINFCEQWTDAPFFQNGTLCSPKLADNIIAGCEAQARALSDEAEKQGNYFPYTKCDITIFTPDKNGTLLSLNTRVDIGDREQESLKDHLEKICRNKPDREVFAKFSDALSERADRRKLIVPNRPEEPPVNEHESPGEKSKNEENLTRKEWGEKIEDEKNKSSQEHNGKEQNTQNKGDRDRTA